MSNKLYNEILVISVGITPQIVTETLFYYYKLAKTIRKFSKIVLITTEAGREKLVEELFDNKWLNKLENKLGFKANQIPLKEDDIHVIKDKDGQPIWDVRNTEESKYETKLLFHLFKELTNDADSRLTVTVAGGRKSMGVSTGLALQLFGRDQDEMIHIIVPQERFNDKEWFFPEDPKCESEKIEVSDIPFIKIRKLVSDTLNVDDPDELLEIAQTRLDEVSPIQHLVIQKNSIIIDSNTIQLSPLNMMVWRYLARKKIENCTSDPNEICPGCAGCYVTHYTMIEELDTNLFQEYSVLVNNKSQRFIDYVDTLVDLKNELIMGGEKDLRVRHHRTKLKKQLRERAPFSLQDQLIPDIIENDEGKTAFGLKIAKNAIKFED